MKKTLVTLLFLSITALAFGQEKLISYEDIRYLLHNNLDKADTFLLAKGYTMSQADVKNKRRGYVINMGDGTKSYLNLRADGKKIVMEIETDAIEQYNLLLNSISQFRVKDSNVGDVQVYQVKDLATIYITITDKVPYDQLRKDYDINIVADKNVTAIN